MNPFDTARLSTPEVLHEVEYLIGTDNSARLAERLGYSSVDGLILAVRRAGRPDLADRLARTIPLPLDGMKAAATLGLGSPTYSLSHRAAWNRRQVAA